MKQFQHFKESQHVGGESVGYFASVAEGWNSGLPRTNPASICLVGLELGASGLKVNPTTLPPLR